LLAAVVVLIPRRNFMTKTPECIQPPDTTPLESGVWILLKVIAFPFALPAALLYAIELFLA
jgi:hypothetical protein